MTTNRSSCLYPPVDTNQQELIRSLSLTINEVWLLLINREHGYRAGITSSGPLVGSSVKRTRHIAATGRWQTKQAADRTQTRGAPARLCRAAAAGHHDVSGYSLDRTKLRDFG